MNTDQISLTIQIKKVIGDRILFFSVMFMFIIFGLTIYDLSISVTHLRSRINEQVKPIEDFAIDQAMINNLDTVKLKIDSFNENNTSFKVKWVKSGEPKYNRIAWRFPFSWVYDYRIRDIAGIHFGYFKITGSFLADKTSLYDLMIRLIFLAIFTGSILCILFPLAKKIPHQLFISPINRFLDLVSNNPSQNAISSQSLPIELAMLESKILLLLKTATEHERNKADIELGQLSARLAHDIRSPLLAMEMSIRNLPCGELSILTSGIQQVRDIANNVLKRYHQPPQEIDQSASGIYQDDGNIKRPILLSNLVDLIVSQKRHEWNFLSNNLVATTQPIARSAWAAASPNDVKRILSNLLNNAFDAISTHDSGHIELFLNLIDSYLILQIKDTGIGIPPDKIQDVLRGVSLKHDGKGLGLSVAKRYLERIGGKLEIHSTLGKGTEITLFFPQAENPSWYTEKIRLENAATAIILDDDFSMLAYWEQRLSELNIKSKLFSSYEKALHWIKDNNKLISSMIFIADYELSDKNVNGLMFLEKIDSKHRYLITNHAEDYHCQLAAEKAGIWLIPKSSMNEIKLMN